MEAWIVLVLLVVTVGLFVWEKVSVDVVTLAVLCVLALTGVLEVKEVFQGFGTDIVVMLASIFVIGTAMRYSGALDLVAQRLASVFGKKPARLTATMMGFTGVMSAFMNNTTVTAILVGPVVRLARQIGFSPSRLLMPLAFASILGGTCTLIGTSTNVAVSGYVAQHQMEEFGMFEFTGIGVVVLIVGILYILLLGKRLLPNASESLQTLEEREYLAEVAILEESPLIGQPVFESDFSVLEFQVIKVLRDGDELQPSTGLRFRAGDRVLVAGKVEQLIRVKKIEGIDILEDVKLRDRGADAAAEQIAEVILTPRSQLVGHTLRETHFRNVTGLSVLALMRGATSLRTKIADTALRAGDMMLVQGSPALISRFEEESELVVISEYANPGLGLKRGLIVMAVFALAIIASAIGFVAAPLAMLITAIVAVMIGAVSLERAYENIDWRLLVLIAGMTTFGHAMSKSGAADMVAQAMMTVLAPLGPMTVLGGFALLTAVLTQPMSNAAAALVVLPIALSAAEAMNLEPRTFALVVMLSASVAVATPFEPSCLLVYGPGKYRFRDFVIVGGGLTLICLAVVLVLVPVFWPLKAG